jgi:hypothetical protein
MKPKNWTNPNANATGITGAISLCITGTLGLFGVTITPELAIAYTTVAGYLVLRFAPGKS